MVTFVFGSSWREQADWQMGLHVMKVFRDRLGGEEHDFSKRVDPILNVPTVADEQMDRINHAPHTLSSLAKLYESPGMIPATPAAVVLSSQRFKQSSEANNDEQAQW